LVRHGSLQPISPALYEDFSCPRILADPLPPVLDWDYRELIPLPSLIPAQKTVQTLRESSFGIRAAQLFNRMPAEVRHAKSIEIVKIKLGEFLATIPDLPPVRGYSSPRDNSLVALLTEGS